MQTIHENVAEGASTARSLHRERIEVLRQRAGLLCGKERVLMTMYLENGNSFRQLAQLAGVNQANIARRINRITRRLMDGQYIECLRHRDKLTALEMQVAKDFFLRGLSRRKIAHRHRSSPYKIGKIIRRIRRRTAPAMNG